MVYTGEPSMFWRDGWEAWTPTVPTHVLMSLPWPIHDVLQIPVPGMTKGNCLGLVTAGAVLCLLGEPRKALVDVKSPLKPELWEVHLIIYLTRKKNDWDLDLCWSWSEDNSMGACEGKKSSRNKIRILVKRLNRQGQRGYKAWRHPWKDWCWGVSQQSEGYMMLHPVFA